MRRWFLFVLLLSAVQTAHAQNVSGDNEDFRDADPGNDYGIEDARMRSLLSQPLDAYSDPVSKALTYNPFETRFRRRGYPDAFRRITAGGIDLSRMFYGQYYGVLSAMDWRFPALSRSGGASSAGDNIVNNAAGTMEYDIRPSQLPSASGISYTLSDYRYRHRVRVYSSGNDTEHKFAYHISASRSWGEDSHIGGVFTDAGSVSLALEKGFRKLSLSLLAGAAPGQSGERSYTVREAFDLAGDNLYNPSWGYQNGRKRNSRVTDRITPFAILSARARLGKDLSLNTSVSFIAGHESRSALGWYDARNPRPDYYMSLPSGANNPSLTLEIADLWKQRDPRVMHINWREFYISNEGDDAAQYFLEKRTEDTRALQWFASLDYTISHSARLTAGIRLRTDRSSNFKVMGDLFEGNAGPDIDPYLTDRYGLGGKALNDLLNPGRAISRRDRFGYNYDLISSGGYAYGIITFHGEKYSSTLAAEAGTVNAYRKGLYEKGLYPGTESLGRSEKIAFTPYTLNASFRYRLSSGSEVTLSAMTGNVVPAIDGIFVEPEYRNTLLHDAGNVHIQSADLSLRHRSPKLDLSVTAYYTATQGETEAYNHYNDILGAYTFAAVSDISKRYYGIEAGADYMISPSFTLLCVAALNKGIYGSDPLVTFSGNEPGKQETEAPFPSHNKGLRIGNTPQLTALAELSFRTRRMLNIALTVKYAGDNYIGINPVFRNEYWTGVESQNYNDILNTPQEKYKARVTLDFRISQTFKIRKHYLTAGIYINNIQNIKDIVYSGYESSRITKTPVRDYYEYKQRPSTYLYGYGRTVTMNISFKL